MKRAFCLILALCLFLTACGGTSAPAETTNTDWFLTIVIGAAALLIGAVAGYFLCFAVQKKRRY